MKKFLPLLLAVVFISSCEDNEMEVTLTANFSINESMAIQVSQTNGTAVPYDEMVSQDLNEVVANFDDVSDITINSLSYQYQNISGNTNAVLESATIRINGNEIANISFVNVAQEANNGSVFNITDQTVLNQLEDLLLSNASLDVQFTGTAISNESPVSFDLELFLNITVALN